MYIRVRIVKKVKKEHHFRVSTYVWLARRPCLIHRVGGAFIISKEFKISTYSMKKTWPVQSMDETWPVQFCFMDHSSIYGIVQSDS